PRAFERRTGGAMGDHLPRFHGELKIGRYRRAPPGGGCQFWQAVERGVDFDARECPAILRLRPGKAAAADIYDGSTPRQRAGQSSNRLRACKVLFTRA